MAVEHYVVNTAPVCDIVGNPCGCKLVRFARRGILAVPCDRHLGRLTVEMKLREEVDSEPVVTTL